MRLLLLALCACSLLCFAGCGSSADGPTTQVEVMHMQATLPGSDWHKASEGKKGLLDTERWENGDGSLFFRVANNPDDVLSIPRIDNSLVDQYISLMGFPPSTLVQPSTIMGRDAIRIEGVSSEAADYHTIDYAFAAALRPFYVGAGASNSIWDAGGSDAVYDILESVKVAIVK
jgi:hypothetical protein